MLLVALCACSSDCAAEAVVGGCEKASVTDSGVVAAADFATKAESKAMQPPGKLQLLKILEAEQQVVAGMNYRLVLRVKQDGKERTAEAVVWWQAWRPAPYQLTSWTWK